MKDPFWRVLEEEPKFKLHLRPGFLLVSMEFDDVCTLPVYGAEIDAVRKAAKTSGN